MKSLPMERFFLKAATPARLRSKLGSKASDVDSESLRDPHRVVLALFSWAEQVRKIGRCSSGWAPKAGALMLVAIIGGCGKSDRIVASSIPLDDYHQRHPIVVAEASTSIDVFPTMASGRMDKLTAKQIIAFAGQYRELGRGPILVLLPNGPRVDNGRGRGLVTDIKQALALGGARGGVEVSTYPANDPGLAAPVRLSFVGIRAKVADQCGQWPKDLNSGDSVEGWDNKPYWNLGCAQQQMLAAQVSDPRDLVTPRGEEKTDTIVRMRAIDSIRKGSDPNTSWNVKNSSIGSVGSN